MRPTAVAAPATVAVRFDLAGIAELGDHSTLIVN